MSTVPSSTAKDKTTAKAAGVGTAKPSVTGSSSALAAPRGPLSRQLSRLPLLGWAVLGALAAGVYGRLGLGMRFGPPLVMVALGGLTLALTAAALWRVIDPLTRNALSVIPEAARAPHRVRELEREKQTVLKAIKEIELDYQMRKISEADYREMVERYRARALRIMGDLAAGDDYRALIERELRDRLAARVAADAATSPDPDVPASGAPDRESGVKARAPATLSDVAATAATAATPGSATIACRACAAINDPDAQYCKRCGQKLTFPASPV